MGRARFPTAPRRSGGCGDGSDARRRCEVFAKWFLNEAQTDDARRLLASGEYLVAPAHASAEVGHVLARHVRDGGMSIALMHRALASLSKIVLTIPLSDLHAVAVVVAVETGASFYDALYVSAARAWTTKLITADRRLLRSLAGSGWHHDAIDLRPWAR